MQQQLFGGPLKSSDEMENIGEKVGALTEQVAVREREGTQNQVTPGERRRR